MNFINAVISGFGFTAGVLLFLTFMCFVGIIINLLSIKIQARPSDGEAPDDPKYGKAVWHPSIFMPRRASRILLEVTDVKVERLQDITEEDAEKEGMPDEYPIAPVYCPNCQGQGTCGAVHPKSLGYMEIDCPECDTAKKKFKNLWDSINGRGRKPGKAWNDNPWVWVVEFRRVENV